MYCKGPGLKQHPGPLAEAGGNVIPCPFVVLGRSHAAITDVASDNKKIQYNNRESMVAWNIEEREGSLT
jgi:hypothetical protein